MQMPPHNKLILALKHKKTTIITLIALILIIVFGHMARYRELGRIFNVPSVHYLEHFDAIVAETIDCDSWYADPHRRPFDAVTSRRNSIIYMFPYSPIPYTPTFVTMYEEIAVEIFYVLSSIRVRPLLPLYRIRRNPSWINDGFVQFTMAQPYKWEELTIILFYYNQPFVMISGRRYRIHE